MRQRGYARQDLEAALKTRLFTMDAMDRKRTRYTMDAMDTLIGSASVCGKRSRADALHSDFVLDEGVVKCRAERRGRRIKDKWSAEDASPLVGVDATISAWKADRHNQSLGRGLLRPSLRGSGSRGEGARVKCVEQGRSFRACGWWGSLEIYK